MNCRKLIKILLFGTVISSTYGDPCEEINAYASSNSIELDCSSNGELKVEVNNFLKEEAKEDFIQKFLKQFPDIEILNISYRKLTCELIIPENSKLRELHAAGNELSGKLNILEISKLEYLDASDNNLEGELNIPNNTTLKFLNVGYNKLTGSIIIPENSKLEVLNVHNNNLSGQLIIPKNSNLKELGANNNKLTGNITIPESLIEFAAPHNQLTGDIIIPENSKLERLYVNNNKFNGKIIIPENCNLERVDISNNELKGEITLTKSSRIRELNAKGNDINVSCDADTYETYTNYCELKFKKQKKNFPYIIGSSLILICMIIFLILIILDNKKKRKLSEKNESNDDLLEINVQENSFKVGKCYIAGSNYIPRKVDEITISANDRISIIEVLDNGRANGKNLNTQQSGIFPLSCLKSEIIVQNKEIRTNQNSIYCLSITIVLCAIVFFINC
jgi:hypothetical protein